MRAVRNFEAWGAEGLELLLVVLNDAAVISRQIALATKEGRVWEENVRLSTWKRAFDHCHDLIGWALEELLTISLFLFLICHWLTVSNTALRDLLLYCWLAQLALKLFHRGGLLARVICHGLVYRLGLFFLCFLDRVSFLYFIEMLASFRRSSFSTPSITTLF